MPKLLAYLSSPYATLALLAVVVILLVVLIHLYHKLSVFMRGENGKSLESTVRSYLDKVDDLKKHDELIAEHALNLDNRLGQCIRNVSTIRFKAFDQNSSNQSFATALLNEHGDGVIISSLHHRDHVSMYAKPITHYTSTHDLTEEEIGVLEQTKKAHIKEGVLGKK